MTGTEHQKDPSDRDMLEDLFRHASARERPPPGDEQKVRDALHGQWSEMTGRSKRRRAVAYWAAVASVVLAVVASFILTRNPGPVTPVMQVAEVDKIVGSPLSYSGADTVAQKLAVSTALDSGQRLKTPAGSGLSIRWFNGDSIRLDQNSELGLESAHEIKLLSGSVYIVSDDANPSGRLVIATPAGQVRHIGTRYMTTVSAGGTAVSVREGRVLINAQGVESVASRGEQLSVDTTGKRSLESIPTFGSLWDWTETLSPAFFSDGRSIAEFLNWVASESGRKVEFATPAAEELAGTAVLHGNVDMQPMRALSLMLQTSDLDSEILGGTILIRLRANN